MQPVPYVPAPPPPPPPMVFAPKPQPPDDRDERRQLIDRIKKYRQGFDAAKALPFNEDMSTDRLRSLLDDIRLSISSRNTSLIFRSGYLTAVKGVELVGTKTGLRCYGLADALGKSAEVSDLFFRYLKLPEDIADCARAAVRARAYKYAHGGSRRTPHSAPPLPWPS